MKKVFFSMLVMLVAVPATAEHWHGGELCRMDDGACRAYAEDQRRALEPLQEVSQARYLTRVGPEDQSYRVEKRPTQPVNQRVYQTSTLDQITDGVIARQNTPTGSYHSSDQRYTMWVNGQPVQTREQLAIANAAHGQESDRKLVDQRVVDSQVDNHIRLEKSAVDNEIDLREQAEDEADGTIGRWERGVRIVTRGVNDGVRAVGNGAVTVGKIKKVFGDD